MTIVQINSTCGKGSTGKICISISSLLNKKGFRNYIFYSHGHSTYSRGIKFGFKIYYKYQALKGRILGNNGFNSHFSTWWLVKKLKKINPDIVHLHNLHSNDINLEILFDYLKENHIKVFWTFHDCWAFTAYCPHFTMLKCEKYKSTCHDCEYRNNSSWLFDRSKELQERKKNAIEGCNLTIITPSQWLSDCVRESCLKSFPVKVINNGIDLEIFKPTPSNLGEKWGNKFIVLGVAFDWEYRKGLDVFIELAKKLPKEYQIVLVGTNSDVDRLLPKNIISIHRTQNQQELAKLYSVADIFVNPTREDNYPTVNIESLACGTPVLTFRTGGSPEILDVTCGNTVECEDLDSLIKEIIRICEIKPFSKEDCIKKAKQYDMNARFEEYVNLYCNVL